MALEHLQGFVSAAAPGTYSPWIVRVTVVVIVEGCCYKYTHNSPLSPACVLSQMREKKESSEQ